MQRHPLLFTTTHTCATLLLQPTKALEQAAAAPAAAAAAAAARALLRQTFRLLSALEDTGHSARREALATDPRRSLLDGVMRAVLKRVDNARGVDNRVLWKWEALLNALPPRDALRTLAYVRPQDCRMVQHAAVMSKWQAPLCAVLHTMCSTHS